MKLLKDIPYKSTGKECNIMDIYLPDTEEFPVFIYFHGGGLEHGCKTDNKFYEALAQKGIAVVTADYRMYPEAKYPDFLDDGAAVVSWVKQNMNEYGKVSKIFVGGSSAGGYMSQMLCFDKKYLAKYGIDSDSLSGYVHDAGQPTVHFNVVRERGLDGRRVIIDEAAPIYHITENRNYAPMLIIVSDMDMENRLEQTQLLVSTMRHFGYSDKVDYIIMKNSTHTSYVDAVSDDGKLVFAEMIYNFIQKNK